MRYGHMGTYQLAGNIRPGGHGSEASGGKRVVESYIPWAFA